MKKLFILAVLLMLGRIAFAQDAQLSDKVSAIETKIVNMEATIASMQKTLSEVTAQNLALKQSLHLQPTIAEATTPNDISFRLISAKGDRRTGKVEFGFTVVNNAKRDQTFQAYDINFVDENGYAINVDGREDASIANHWLETYITTLYTDTPVEMKINVALNTEPQYAKLIDIVAIEKKDSVRFINIPIKWE